MTTIFSGIREIIQEDVGRRGLATDPVRNLLNACPDDLRFACASIAAAPKPVVAIVTGFYIPTAAPPAGETDGPLGAVFLARALVPLGCRVIIVTDGFCVRAILAGLRVCNLEQQVTIIALPIAQRAAAMTAEQSWQQFVNFTGETPTHLVALERVGPSHTLESLQAQYGGGDSEALGQTYLDFLDAVPPEHQDRCHTMRGIDITDRMSPAHRLFEFAHRDKNVTTIGIGDGGNEIGMGKIPWDVIERNVAGGGLVACRVATQHLIVCGISNWGAYGLARGVWALRGRAFHPALANPNHERTILKTMVEQGPLVDGVTGRPSLSVDGLDFDRYITALQRLAGLV